MTKILVSKKTVHIQANSKKVFSLALIWMQTGFTSYVNDSPVSCSTDVFHIVNGGSGPVKFRKLRCLGVVLQLREDNYIRLGFCFEFSLIAMSRLAAAIVDGRYSRKAAVRIVWRQRFFDILQTQQELGFAAWSYSNILRNLSRNGRGDVYVKSNSSAFNTRFSSFTKYFFRIEKRRDDYSIKEERTAKDGLSSCSNLPESITAVTARTTASGAELLVTAWLIMYLSAMLVAR